MLNVHSWSGAAGLNSRSRTAFRPSSAVPMTTKVAPNSGTTCASPVVPGPSVGGAGRQLARAGGRRGLVRAARSRSLHHVGFGSPPHDTTVNERRREREARRHRGRIHDARHSVARPCASPRLIAAVLVPSPPLGHLPPMRFAFALLSTTLLTLAACPGGGGDTDTDTSTRAVQRPRPTPPPRAARPRRPRRTRPRRPPDRPPATSPWRATTRFPTRAPRARSR